MKTCDNIYCVGMMGAGKTTIGRQLARRLKKHFVDCDHEVEARTGVRIPLIFEIEGEPGFRRREPALSFGVPRPTFNPSANSLKSINFLAYRRRSGKLRGPRRDGGTGRRTGLKIRRANHS